MMVIDGYLLQDALVCVPQGALLSTNNERTTTGTEGVGADILGRLQLNLKDIQHTQAHAKHQTILLYIPYKHQPTRRTDQHQQLSRPEHMSSDVNSPTLLTNQNIGITTSGTRHFWIMRSHISYENFKT